MTINLPTGETLMTPAEAASKLNMSIKTLRRHVAKGALRYINIAPKGAARKCMRFTPKNLETFLENQKVRECPPCQSTSVKRSRPSTITSSSSAVIGFTALQELKTKKTLKNLKGK